MKVPASEAVLDWFEKNPEGSTETVALALRMNASTAYAAIRVLLSRSDIRLAREEEVKVGRRRVHKRYVYALVPKAAPTRPLSLVQQALAARPALQSVWGARC
jgi:predicted transcriptional regulator